MANPSNDESTDILAARYEDDSIRVDVSISHDLTTAYLFVRIEPDVLSKREQDKATALNIISEEMINRLLVEGEITHGVQRASILKIVRIVNEVARNVSREEVALGEAPVAGRDGFLSLAAELTKNKKEGGAKKEGIINVKEHEMIGSIISPVKGEFGTNVMGEPIPATPGNAYSPIIGDGVNLDKSSNALYATRDGHAAISSDAVDVKEDYTHTKDVDIKSGSLFFLGNLLICGDVQDEFNVLAAKSIAINGNIGKSKVKATGNIVVKGGISGRETGQIETDSSLSIKYLDEANVLVAQNLIVEKEVLNSHIKVFGRFQMLRGSLVGGSTLAMNAAEVAVLGSSLGIKTEIMVGREYMRNCRRDQLKAMAKKLEANIKRISDAVEPFFSLENKDKFLDLPKEKLAVVKELMAQAQDLKPKYDAVLKEIEEINEADDSGLKVCYQINVLKIVHPGAEIALGNATLSINDAIKGPLSFILTPDKESIRTVSYQQLPEIES